MPRVLVLADAAGADGSFYEAGDTVDLSPERAKGAVAGGWGELVREPETPETPEAPRGRAAARPETRRAR